MVQSSLRKDVIDVLSALNLEWLEFIIKIEMVFLFNYDYHSEFRRPLLKVNYRLSFGIKIKMEKSQRKLKWIYNYSAGSTSLTISFIVNYII